MSEYRQVLTTIDDHEAASELADAVVRERLAACAQVLGPIESTYRWEGEIVTDEEWVCLMKSTDGRFEALERTIEELHPYDTPEIVATPVVSGSAAYLSWIETEVTDAE